MTMKKTPPTTKNSFASAIEEIKMNLFKRKKHNNTDFTPVHTVSRSVMMVGGVAAFIFNDPSFVALLPEPFYDGMINGAGKALSFITITEIWKIYNRYRSNRNAAEAKTALQLLYVRVTFDSKKLPIWVTEALYQNTSFHKATKTAVITDPRQAKACVELEAKKSIDHETLPVFQLEPNRMIVGQADRKSVSKILDLDGTGMKEKMA